jgi:hypothetical protein
MSWSYGEYQVSRAEVDQCIPHYNEIDFLKAWIKSSRLSVNTGWYARKVEPGVFKFLVTDNPNIRRKKEYLDALLVDGWEIIR